MEDEPPVNHRITQPQISFLMTGEERKRIAGYPGICMDCRHFLPGKRAIGLCLIELIDAQRVMCGGPTECVSLISGAHIAKGSGINQERFSIDGIAHAECIGVPMT